MLNEVFVAWYEVESRKLSDGAEKKCKNYGEGK
jgi:hypothetical protein